jgi:hypothetical protein
MPILPHETVEVPTRLISAVQQRVFIENNLPEPVEIQAIDNLDGSHPQIHIKLAQPKKPT